MFKLKIRYCRCKQGTFCILLKRKLVAIASSLLIKVGLPMKVLVRLKKPNVAKLLECLSIELPHDDGHKNVAIIKLSLKNSKPLLHLQLAI